MQHPQKEPTLFVNILRFDGVEHAEGEVLHSRAAAVEDVEGWYDRYCYTLTDIGVIDLSDDFPDSYHARRARDAETERRIDDAKEALAPIYSFTLMERA